MSVYIIAEAGVNHNGSLETAKRMIASAKRTGCSCIKFQTFQAEQLVTVQAKKAAYQMKTTESNGSQYEMLKALELSAQNFMELKKCCENEGIDFLSTPFEEASAELLRQLGLSIWKIPSGEITNQPFLQHIGSYQQKVILSTGMSTLEEVEKAVEWLRESGTKDITLLHCTSNYPTPPKDVNMRAMLTLQEHFQLPVGYSDHTEGIVIPVMAAAMGACVIEKHFTLDRTMPGPDHKASLEPDELRQMVQSIRIVEQAYGTGEKKPTQSELETRIAARKSVVLARPVPSGQPLTIEDLAIKRPGYGIPPYDFSKVIGRKLSHDLPQNSVLSDEDFTKELQE